MAHTHTHTHKKWLPANKTEDHRKKIVLIKRGFLQLVLWKKWLNKEKKNQDTKEIIIFRKEKLYS